MTWLVSPAFDLGLIAGPAFLPAVLVLLFPALRAEGETPLWAWIAFVLLVDVAHVYASLYRTYFDLAELRRRPLLYLLTPLACLGAGLGLYALGGALAFWRALAYLAVFHFARQQYGLLALYGPSRIGKAAIYAATLGPIAYWHTHLPRPFEWFMPGDFVELPRLLWPAAFAGCVGVYAAYAWSELHLWRTRGVVAPGRIAVVGSTLASWWTGIVLCSSDLAFTFTNTVAHGVPYVALVWLTVRRQRRRGFLGEIAQPVALPLFLGILFVLAWAEEGLWDVFVWQQHPQVFGASGVAWAHDWLWLTVPLLTVPQATHYVLDGFIWKMDGSNPGLREALIGEAK